MQGRIADEGLAGKVILLGAIDDVESLIAAMDMVMLGSRYGEALPMTLLEALFCEAPIVATRGGDVGLLPIPEYALAPSGDPEALARALGRVWDGEAGAWDASFAKVREEYRQRPQHPKRLLRSLSAGRWRRAVPSK